MPCHTCRVGVCHAEQPAVAGQKPDMHANSNRCATAWHTGHILTTVHTAHISLTPCSGSTGWCLSHTQFLCWPCTAPHSGWPNSLTCMQAGSTWATAARTRLALAALWTMKQAADVSTHHAIVPLDGIHDISMHSHTTCKPWWPQKPAAAVIQQPPTNNAKQHAAAITASIPTPRRMLHR